MGDGNKEEPYNPYVYMGAQYYHNTGSPASLRANGVSPIPGSPSMPSNSGYSLSGSNGVQQAMFGGSQRFSGSSMLHYGNTGKHPAPLMSYGSQSSLASASANGNYQRQLEYAQQSRLASSPHHHARLLAASIAASAAAPSHSSTSNLRSSTSTFGSQSLGAIQHSGSEVSVASHSNAAGNVVQQQNKDQQWTAIDIGGMLIATMSLSLFKYDFLTHLYLNHNKLLAVPPEIAKLRRLVVLNLTANKLRSIPAELGLIVSLKELLLFDNELAFLPPELGQLYQLDIIGLEGNPLSEPFPTLLQKDGTLGVIKYLRDMCPGKVYSMKEIQPSINSIMHQLKLEHRLLIENGFCWKTIHTM